MSQTLPLITVLVVNDQLPVCKLWQQLIDKTPGMNCPAYALDGDAAIEIVREIQPDIVLMDILMPGMRGDEAMHIIQAEFPQTIVVMYSADSSTEHIARDAGALEFILMPILPSELITTLRRIYREAHGYVW